MRRAILILISEILENRKYNGPRILVVEVNLSDQFFPFSAVIEVLIVVDFPILIQFCSTSLGLLQPNLAQIVLAYVEPEFL